MDPWANRNGFVGWNKDITRSGWADAPMVETVEYLLSLIYDDRTMPNPLDNVIPGGVQQGLPGG